MSVQWTRDSAYAKEAVKWEMDYSEFGPPGRPRASVGFQEFPKMLSLAGRNSQGIPGIADTQTVGNADEEARYLAKGYRAGGDKALEALHQRDAEIAELAANRAFTEKTMSPAAKAEAAAWDASTAQHLPAIPDTPIVKRQKKEAS